MVLASKLAEKGTLMGVSLFKQHGVFFNLP